ncbi:MAG: glutathione synthase [Gammaproteobacteria bacterium]
MKHAFIMDPLAQIKPWKDTTYLLIRACIERGHSVCHIDQRALWLAHTQLRAEADWLELDQRAHIPLRAARREEIELARCDAVWIRADPPFDRRYFYTTLLLDRLPAAVRVINRPCGIRNANEKLAALSHPHYSPPTLVTRDAQRIKDFARQHERITLKPIDGFGGRDIHFYRDGDDTRAPERATRDGHHMAIAQAYLPAARDGDKRILLLNGEPLGAILRVHAAGKELNNLDAGGTAHPADLTARDLEICAAIKPMLIKQGIFFAGIDIIGGMLIEINVTSPTGLQELCAFDEQMYHHRVVEAVERMVATG